MVDFSVQIANYKNYGIYNYKFDDVGNELLNPSSSTFQQVYFSLPFLNYQYNNSKILSFYDPTFIEFIPTTSSIETSVFPQDAIDEINAITYQNLQLQNQLETLVNVSEQNSSNADTELVKTTLINLRIQLGQGTTSSDFDTVFPYLPLDKSLINITIPPTNVTSPTIIPPVSQPTMSNTLPTSSVTITSSNAIQYVFVSKDFGTNVVGGVTYYRLVYMDINVNRAFDFPSSGMIRNLQGVYGQPIHGQYVSVTQAQYNDLLKTQNVNIPNLTSNGRLTATSTEFSQQIATAEASANITPVIINGVKYLSVPRIAYSFWGGYQDYFKNGNTAIQNEERYNGPHMFPTAQRWTRANQVGYMGALGPP